MAKRNIELLDRIERTIILLTLGLTAVAFYFEQVTGGVGAILGGSVAFTNFKLIRFGVNKLFEVRTSKARRTYYVTSSLKLLSFTVVLGLIFYFVHPSVIFFLLGFSLFIPSILIESLFHPDHNVQIEETISGY